MTLIQTLASIDDQLGAQGVDEYSEERMALRYAQAQLTTMEQALEFYARVSEQPWPFSADYLRKDNGAAALKALGREVQP